MVTVLATGDKCLDNQDLLFKYTLTPAVLPSIHPKSPVDLYFIMYTHLEPIALSLGGKSTTVQVWLYSRGWITCCMESIHNLSWMLH